MAMITIDLVLACFCCQLTLGLVTPRLGILPSVIGNEARIGITAAAFSRTSCRLPFHGTAAIVEA